MAKAKINWFVVDTAVRVSAPLALEAAVFRGASTILLDHAQKLRALPPVRNQRSARAAREVVEAASDAAYVVYNPSWRAVDEAAATMAVVGGSQEELANVAMAISHATDAAAFFVEEVGENDHDWYRTRALGSTSAHLIRYLDLDVHGMAELETALVATDLLHRLQLIIQMAEKEGWRPPTKKFDSKLRKPVWAALPGAEAVHPDWSTFMAWPIEDKRKLIGLLIDAVAKQE